MFCPKCGHEQADDDVRFCSRCGFSLGEVPGLLERGGELPPPPKRRARDAAYFLAAVVPLLILALIAGRVGLDGIPEVFGILALISLLIGVVRALYVALSGGRAHSEAVPATGRVEPPQQHALPLYTPPVDLPRERFDTGEIAEPPSVAEHTTRHLERESPRER